MNEVQRSVIEAIDKRIGLLTRRLRFDYTLYGRVDSIDGSLINTTVDGVNRALRIKHGVDVEVGDVVIIKVPNSDMSFAYIDGKLKREVV